MNVLFVSIAFPPKQDAECLQTARYFKYLSKNKNLDLTVVTSSLPTLNMPYDTSLEKYNKGYTQKIELSIPENKYLNFIIRKIFPLFLKTPDSKFFFHRQSGKVIKRIEKIPDVIYSRSSPMSSALLALKLKKRFKKPWVMHISDPWADSPLHNYTGTTYKKNKKLEQQCFYYADKICFTTCKTFEFYSRHYPEYIQKFEVFPNVFDPEDVIENDIVTDNTKLKIVHTGGLSAKRSPLYLFPVLEQLRKEGFDTDANLEIIFAGDADRYNRHILSVNKFSCFHYIGRVDYDKSRELQKQANLLLCIEDPVENENDSIFFPSKILDYIVAGKIFFALTSKGSQLARTFKKYQWPFFTHHDITGIVQFIKEASVHLQRNSKIFFKLKEIPEEFNAAKNAERLFDLFKQLCKIS